MNHISLNYLYKKAEQAIGTILMCAVAFAFASCRHDDDMQPTPVYEDRYIPLQLCIPANTATVRSPGDPGADPRLPLPDYLYLFTVVQTGGGSGAVVLRETLADIGDQWVHHGEGSSAVFRYEGSINMPFIENATSAKCYIVAGGSALTFSPVTPQTETEVKDLQLSLLKDDGNDNVQLRDIYSSWHPDDAPDGGLTVTDYGQNQSSVEGTLYHVGAKVDLQWNVTEAFRQAHPGWGVHSVDIHCPGTGYVFRPTKNANEENRIQVFETDAGNAYYGRTDFYVWQRSDRAVHWEIDFAEANDDGQTDIRTVRGISAPTEEEPGQVAYYRLTFTINGMNSAGVGTGDGN